MQVMGSNWMCGTSAYSWPEQEELEYVDSMLAKTFCLQLECQIKSPPNKLSHNPWRSLREYLLTWGN
jgi:hypothetical protein